MTIIDGLRRCIRRWCGVQDAADLVAETEFAVWERQELWQVVPLLQDCRNLLTQLTAGIDPLTENTQIATASTILNILRAHHAITYHAGISDVVEACECCAHIGTRMDVDQWARHVLGLLVEAFPVSAGIGSAADTVTPLS